jgi:hypothetical protein
MEWRTQLNSILDKIKLNLDDPNWLSDAVVVLASLLIHSSEDISRAQLRENATALAVMDAGGEKRVTVSEADKRAIAESENLYKQLTLEREGIIETVNALKIRLNVLGWEQKHG